MVVCASSPLAANVRGLPDSGHELSDAGAARASVRGRGGKRNHQTSGCSPLQCKARSVKPVRQIRLAVEGETAMDAFRKSRHGG
jgi:hypothetical protein